MKIHKKISQLLVLISLFVSIPFAALAFDSSDCQGCHADASVVGEKLVIETLAFDHTAHAELGCQTCHASITDDHPDDGLTPTKASCSECHVDISEEYGGSLHAENAACSDCHNPHRALGPTAVSGHDMNLKCFDCHEHDDMQVTACQVVATSRFAPQHAALHYLSFPNRRFRDQPVHNQTSGWLALR